MPGNTKKPANLKWSEVLSCDSSDADWLNSFSYILLFFFFFSDTRVLYAGVYSQRECGAYIVVAHVFRVVL